jgi:hypothetical protein
MVPKILMQKCPPVEDGREYEYDGDGAEILMQKCPPVEDGREYEYDGRRCRDINAQMPTCIERMRV